MRKSTRMMLMSNRGNGGRCEGGQMYGGEMYGGRMNGGQMYGENRNGSGEYNTARNEYNGAGMNYGVEGRFRDRRGRTHYDNGRFAPMRSEMGGMDEEEWDKGPFPVWQGNTMAGFSGDRGFRQTGGESTGGEMEHHMKSGSYGSGVEFTPEMAKEWTKNMVNEDGTKGPHWPFEQAKQVMTRRGIVCDPYTFWAVMNALYSDYCAVAKKHGINGVDFYADLAAAWLNDRDAKDNKAALYYECISK